MTVVTVLIEVGPRFGYQHHDPSRESRLRHCRCFFGYTPLDFAREESTAGHREVEAALLEHRPFFKIIWSMQSQWLIYLEQWVLPTRGV